MHRILSITVLFFISNILFAQQQDAYVESIKAYREKYVTEHEVVMGEDKNYFRFFPVNKEYNVACNFIKLDDSTGFAMNTSANILKHYLKYGKLNFTISGAAYQLYVYQSTDLMKTEKYKDYLFVPFTDATTGDESYGGGRYLEFYKQDIQNNTLQLDFNKTYNPYCVYATGYRCPIPPKENRLPVAIKAGEMNFAKSH